MGFYISPDVQYLNYFILILQVSLAIYTLYVLSTCCQKPSCIGALLSGLILVVWSYRYPSQEIFPIMKLAYWFKQDMILTFLVGSLSSVMLVAAYKYRENPRICSFLVFGITLILSAGTLEVSLTSGIALSALAGKTIGLSVSYATFGK